MQHNIGPETLVKEEDLPDKLAKFHDKLHIDEFLSNGIPEELTNALQESQMTMTLNGMFYRTDKQGLVAKTVSDVFTQRKAEKNLMLNYEKELELVDAELAELERLLKECGE